MYQKCVPDLFNSRSMVGFANTTKKRSVNRYNTPAHHKNRRLSFVVNRLQGSPPPPQFPVSKTEILRTENWDPQQSSRDAIPWGEKKRNRPHKQQQQQLYRSYGLLGTCMMHSSTLFPLCTTTNRHTCAIYSPQNTQHTWSPSITHSLKLKTQVVYELHNSTLHEREREKERERECGCLYVFSATYKFVNLCERKTVCVCVYLSSATYLQICKLLLHKNKSKNCETFQNFVRSSKLLIFQRKIICKLVNGSVGRGRPQSALLFSGSDKCFV